MTLRWLFAALHLLGLGMGLGAVWTRARALHGTLDRDGLRRVLIADTWWGIAALIWISTGLVRLLAGMEKGTSYYLQNHFFWAKMALLLLIIALEISVVPGITRWRIAVGKGGQPEAAAAARYATISTIQVWLVLAMVVLATGMARGLGVIPQ